MKADQYDTVFKNGDLTNLMITKKGERSMQPKRLSYGIYKLLKAFLVNYGIHIGGGTHIGDYEVTAVTITPEFDIDNELVLRELYSFTGGRVNIQLSIQSDEDCAWAFWYDLKDYSCTLEKYVYHTTQQSTRYDTLAEMLKALD